jgi:phage-related protein
MGLALLSPLCVLAGCIIPDTLTAAVPPPARIPVYFYRTAQGGEPVRDWLRSLPVDDRHRIGHDLTLVQYGWPVGMPLCRSLGGGLWELRSSLPSRRIARVLFFVHEDRIGVVHGFIKKTQRTPPDDYALARQRMRDMLT